MGFSKYWGPLSERARRRREVDAFSKKKRTNLLFEIHRRPQPGYKEKAESAKQRGVRGRGGRILQRISRAKGRAMKKLPHRARSSVSLEEEG